MSFMLYDTHTRNNRDITPIDGHTLRIYFCGPTVYDRLHVGNLRAMMAADTLVRTARRHGPVLFVRNITDIDDKIILRARERGISIDALTADTIAQYHTDLHTLRILSPDIEPRATQYVPSMISMIERILAHGHAYTQDGHVFFDSTTPIDGIPFARPATEDSTPHARVAHAYGQQRDSDFVLWKPSAADEPGWSSPWGRGRPGWHIECSAMTQDTLGDSFDIHGGGSDLQFPHHSNECRQCRAAFPKSGHARHWMHSGMLNVDGEKMSKSLGNMITLDALLERYHPDTIRIAFFMTQWTHTLDLTTERMQEAEQMRIRLRQRIDPVWTPYIPTHDATTLHDAPGLTALDHNLNTHQMLTDWHTLPPDDVQTATQYMGLFLDPPSTPTAITDPVLLTIIDTRNAARRAKDWATADRLRGELASHHVQVKDLPGGTSTYTYTPTTIV